MIRFENPWAIWLALCFFPAGLFLFATYLGIYRRSQRGITWGLLGLRLGGMFFLILALTKPTWTRETELTDPGRVLVILDNSRSMSLPAANGQPRYSAAKTAVERLTNAVEKRDGAKLIVELFDIEGNPLPKGAPSSPEIDRTDIEKALRQAIKQMRSRTLTGIVVISDGMDTTGRASFQDWRGSATPIHSLGFPATSTGDLDLAVRRPRAPERALVHNALTIDVPIAKTGQASSQATVSIKRGRETLASQKVSLGEGGVEQMVSLTFTPHQPGRFVYTAAIEGEAGERYLGNNAVHFPLRVDAEPIRVLYVEGHLRAEAKFLKAHLEDDLDVALKFVIRRLSPETPDPITQGVFSEEQLKNFDVVILGDMEGGLLRAEDHRQIVKWLDGKNHSLLVLGGYSSFGPAGFRSTPLAEVLPVVFSAEGPQSEAAFNLQLTEKGKQHPIFSLTGDRIKDAETWAKSPRLEGLPLVQRLKPGAEELAIDPGVQVEGKPAIVLAVQRAAGGGQVMVLAADTTWRWSRVARILGQPDTLYSRFWSQSIRWLAGRGLDDERPPLALSTDKPDYDRGQKVIVRVQRQKGTDPEKTKGDVTIEVARPGIAGSQALPVKVNTAEPDVLTAEYFPSAGGRYEVTASLTDAGKLKASQVSEFLVQGSDLELASAGTSPATLKSLADATGGVYLEVDEAEKLAEKIERKERRTAQVVRTEFWNSPLLFVAFLAAVSVEWVVRRKNHLV